MSGFHVEPQWIGLGAALLLLAALAFLDCAPTRAERGENLFWSGWNGLHRPPPIKCWSPTVWADLFISIICC